MKFKKLLILLLGVAPLLLSSASALVMRGEKDPEWIIVQIKESLRLSDDLDSSLSDLAQLEGQVGVTVEKWWAGKKLLQLVSFSDEFSQNDALDIIATLRLSSAVERVVPVSGFNLEFNPGDFDRAYTPYEEIPEVALRGLDAEDLSHTTQIDFEEALNAPHVPNQIIVGWKAEYAWRAGQTGFLDDVSDFHDRAGAHVLREMTPTPTDLIQVIEFDDPEVSLLDKLKDYADSPWVDYVQPNYLYSRYTITPNDTYYTDPGQPYLPKIKAPEAWDPLLGGTTGDHSVVVAVSDTGLNIDHPDFMNRLSVGQRNFYNDGFPADDVTDRDFGTWHGSHVASIIGAQGNNGAGVCPGPSCGYMAGVAWDVRLLIIKTANTSDATVIAMDYAWSNQGHDPAIAFNLSTGWGPTSQPDKFLVKAVERARMNNMVIVAAAGNSGVDCDISTNLINPASIPKDNVIAVGATRMRTDEFDDARPAYSNYGIYRVELGAPGGENPAGPNPLGILGLTQFPDDPSPFAPPYNKLSGTSFSAPQVAGALALVKSKYPWESYAGLRDRVLMGTDDVDVLEAVYRSGRLNLSKALQKRTLIKNLSTRARVEGAEKVMIAGFVIGGSSEPCGAAPLPACLKVAIRGLGPSVPMGVGVNRLVDPVIELYKPNQPVDPNDNWQDDPSAAELTAVGLDPKDESEAAMIRTLPPGAYTVVLRSHGSSSDYGVGLVELYALGNDERFRFQNISTRCLVGTGDNVAIAGTILQNPGPDLDQLNSPATPSPSPTPPPPPKRRILSFGRGPSLQRFGLTGTLPDPFLELHQVQNNVDVIIAYNDQWKDIDGLSTGLQDKLVDPGFMPRPLPGVEQYLNESAIWPTLRPDSYTAILKDTGNASGIGLVEFYEF